MPDQGNGMRLSEHVPMLHQCPGCYSTGLHTVPEGGWIECECGERRTLVDLRSLDKPSGAVEENERLRSIVACFVAVHGSDRVPAEYRALAASCATRAGGQ
jgi:hypothetical protein